MHNVVVTGGSRGFGLAIARRLAAGGYRTIAIARQTSKDFETAAAEIERAGSGALQFVACDLSDLDAIPRVVKTVHDTHGPIHGLVNNAAIGTDGALAMMRDAQIERLIRLNTLSPIVLTRHVVRRMMAEGGGRIVNVASIAAFTGYSGLSVYAATKASMIGFTRALAREVGRVGVNVNAVAPGFADTAMTSTLTAERREQLVRRSALRRLIEPDDVAGAVEFLLGPGARNMTGTVLTIDAGATA